MTPSTEKEHKVGMGTIRDCGCTRHKDPGIQCSTIHTAETGCMLRVHIVIFRVPLEISYDTAASIADESHRYMHALM